MEERVNTGGLLADLGPVEHAALRARVLSLAPHVWRENPVRQESFDVHRHTESIVLLFIDIERWPEIVVQREAGWGHLADVAMPLADAIVRARYAPGGTLVRAMVARLPPGGRINPHTDSHPSFHAGHRLHVPLVTNPRVRFTLAGRPFSLREGHAYEIDNQKPHSVMNNGSEGRIHFIFDYVPPPVPGTAGSAGEFGVRGRKLVTDAG